MRKKWPFLDYYGVETPRDFAVKCVETLIGKTLQQQLQERNVIFLEFFRTLYSGNLAACFDKSRHGFSGGFGIVLSVYSSSESQSIAFAHELAHTFQYDVQTGKLLCCDSIHGKKDWRGEDFAESFAHLWLSYGRHRHNLEELFMVYEELHPEINEEYVVDFKSLWPA